MKKLAIIFLFVLLLVACDPKTSLTDDPTVPVIRLNGAQTVTILVGDPFSDPGAVVDGDYPITVNGSVDNTVPGVYYLTYSFVFEGETYSTQRTVTVSANNSNSFYLFGESTIRIDVNTTWNDPGFYISDNSIFVSITDTVDVTTPGEYIVTYSCFINNTPTSLSRTVIVEDNNSTPDVYSVSDTSLTNDEITVDITIDQAYLYYFTVRLELYQDDILLEDYDLMDGSNYVTFDNLAYGYNYEVKLCLQKPDGENTITTYISLDSFTLESSVTIPTISTTNQVIGNDSISFDYVMTDPDSAYSGLTIYLYDTNGLVQTKQETASSGAIIFDSLDVYTEYYYTIEVSYVKDSNTLTKLYEYTSLTTLLPFDVLTITQPSSALLLDSNESVTISLDNDYEFVVTSVVIDGSSITNYTADADEIVISLDTSNTQNYEFVIDYITITVNGLEVQIDIDETIVYVVEESIEEPVIPYIINVEPDGIYYEYFSDFTVYKVYFYNPSNLIIKDLEINDVLVPSGYSYLNNGQEVHVGTFMGSGGYDDIRITQFSYELDGVTYSVEPQVNHYQDVDSCPVLTEINNKTQLIAWFNGGGGSCASLMADIDLAGENWFPMSQQVIQANFYGNGHTISNITFSGDLTSTNDYSYGFFGQLLYSHVEDLNLVVYSTLINSGAGDLYFGGLAGKMDHSFVKNVTVSGTLNFNYWDDGAIGGLVGLSTNNIIYRVDADMDLYGQIYSPETILAVGGVLGQSVNDEISIVSNQGNIAFPNTTIFTNIYMGGLIGKVENGLLVDVYSSYDYTFTANYAGGLIGMFDSQSSLLRGYYRSGTNGFGNNGTYTGGLIGYNQGTIENCFVLTGVYGPSASTAVGYVYGYNSGTFTNVYYDDSSDIYSGLNPIIAVDNSSLMLTSLTASEIKIQSFYESLGYHDGIYDMDQISFTTYPFFK